MRIKNYNIILICYLTLSSVLYSKAQSLTNYTFTTVTGTYTSLSGNTVRINAIETDDAISSAIPIGFNFVYLGKVYTQLYATSNGVIALGGTPVATENNKNTTDSSLVKVGASYRPVIAPLWHDLGGAGSEAYYQTSGPAGSKVFAIEYKNWKWRYYSGNCISMTVRLYEANGVIEMHYQQEASAPLNPAGSIGITGESLRSYMSVQNTSSSATISRTQEVTNLSSRPASGQIYRFSPPTATINAPTSLTYSSIGGTSFTVNWVDQSTNETNFNVLISTDNINFNRVSNGTISSTTTAGTGTSYSLPINGLIAGNVYYLQVVATNEGVSSGILSGSVSTLAGQTYVWNKTSGTYLFSDANNWTPSRVTPDPSDVLQFSNGSNIVLTGFSSQTIGQLSISSNTSVDIQSSTAAILSINGATGTDLTIQSGCKLGLSSTGTSSVTLRYLNSGCTSQISGTLTIASNSSGNNTYNCANTTTTVSSNGMLVCYGTLTNSSNTNLIFQSGAIYEHGTNNDFPTASFGTATNLIITGITWRTSLSIPAQTGSLIWNCASQTSSIILSSWSIGGVFRVISTGTGGIVNINNYLITSDTFRIDGGTVNMGTTAFTIDVNGQFIINGGTLRALSGNSSITVNINNQKFAQNGGTITTDRPKGFIFNVRDSLIKSSGTMNATNSGSIQLNFVAYDNKLQQVQLSGVNTGIINYYIANGTESSGVMRGIFLRSDIPVNDGAELRVSVNGDGVRGTGQAVYSGNSSLTLDAANGQQNISVQMWGPTTSPAILTLNNLNGARLTASRQLNGILTLTNGLLRINGYILTLGDTATVQGTTNSNRMIVTGNGELRKTFSAGTNLFFIYPVGDTTGTIEYSPIKLDLLTNSQQRTIGVKVTDADHPSLAGASNSLSRYWSFTHPTLGGTYSYKLTASYLSADITGTESLIRAAIRNNNRWYQYNTQIPSSNLLVSNTFSDSEMPITGIDFTGRTQAAYKWTGSVNTSWNQSGNWNISGFPQYENMDDVILNSQSSNQPEIASGSFRIRSIYMDDTLARLTIKGTGSLALSDSLYVSQGTISLMDNAVLSIDKNTTLKGNTKMRDNAILRCSTNVINTGANSFDANTSVQLPNTSAQSFKGIFGNLYLSNGIKNADSMVNIYGVLTLAGSSIELRTNNILTLSSNANNTGSLDNVPTSAIITGNMNIERFVPAGIRSFRTISPPISNFTFQQLIDDIYVSGPGGIMNGFDSTRTNDPTCYRYDEDTTSRGWKSVNHISNTLPACNGAIVFIRGDRTLSSPSWFTAPFPAQNAVTLDFQGLVNRGDITIPLSYTPSSVPTDDGWNLVGNPYPSGIDWNSSQITKNGITNTLYIYNPRTTSYEAFNGNTGFGTGSITSFISSTQGFFVQAIAGNASITFRESAKTTQTTSAFFKTNTSSPFVRFIFERDSIRSDETLLIFSPSGSKTYSVGDDASKMPNSLLNVYTKSSNLVNLQINSYGSLSIIDSIPIIVESVYIGSHRLKWASSSSIPNTKRVLLLDKYTNTLTDMRNFYEYPFQINSNPNSKGANRFVLIIGDNYALPVKWLDANAMVSNHDVWLNWSTTDETNNSHFVLSYSIDNSTFIEFDRVTSSKQILGINKYARLHIDIVSLLKQKGAKKIIYQIKQVDMDGREEYAPLIICNLEKTNLAGIAIRPNPAHDKIYISCNELIQPAQVTITNTLGVAFPVKLNVTNTEWEIELTNQMPTGIYFITIQDIYGAYHQTKFIKE